MRKIEGKVLKQKLKKSTKIWLAVIAGLASLVLIGVAVLKTQSYQPTPQAATVAQQSGQSRDDGLFFAAKKPHGPTVIFYPGALVAPASYSLWAQKLAENGHNVYIARFPLDLAVLSGKRADRYLRQHPDENYVIGGHSLGGVMASRYASQHLSPQLKGVFFFASYPDKKGDLHGTDLPVLSLIAGQDGVLNQKRWREAQAYLSAQTTIAQLIAGNHAGFGSYGAQKGDRPAKVSNAAQQRWIVTEMSEWLAELQ